MTEDSNAKSGKSAWAKVKETALSIGIRSSVHGFPSWSSPSVHWSLKLLWLAIACASWAYFVYLIHGSLVLYYAYGVTTSSTIVYEAPTLFPAVDICNLNPINTDLLSTTDGIEAILPTAVNESDSIMQYADDSLVWLRLIEEDWYQEKVVSSLYSLGPSLTSILISCEYDGQKCSAKDFYWYSDFYYGNCFRFNGGSKDKNQTNPDYSFQASDTVKKAYKHGWRNGLRLQLHTQAQGLFLYKSGFRIVVHNQSSSVNPDEDGIDVPVGLQTNIGVSRTFVKRLADPYSSCMESLDETRARSNQVLNVIWQQMQNGTVSEYAQQYCVEMCFQMYINSTCQCGNGNLYFLGILTLDQLCTEKSEFNCSKTAETEFYEGSQVDACYSACPQECSSVSYKLSVRQAQYPTQWYAAEAAEYLTNFGLQSIFSGSDAKGAIANTTALVNVFYASLDYNYVEESVAFSSDQLLANIGGNLGLTTGMSLLSFVELVELAMTIAFMLAVYKKVKVGAKSDKTEI